MNDTRHHGQPATRHVFCHPLLASLTCRHPCSLPLHSSSLSSRVPVTCPAQPIMPPARPPTSPPCQLRRHPKSILLHAALDCSTADFASPCRAVQQQKKGKKRKEKKEESRALKLSLPHDSPAFLGLGIPPIPGYLRTQPVSGQRNVVLHPSSRFSILTTVATLFMPIPCIDSQRQSLSPLLRPGVCTTSRRRRPLPSPAWYYLQTLRTATLSTLLPYSRAPLLVHMPACLSPDSFFLPLSALFPDLNGKRPATRPIPSSGRTESIQPLNRSPYPPCYPCFLPTYVPHPPLPPLHVASSYKTIISPHRILGPSN